MKIYTKRNRQNFSWTEETAGIFPYPPRRMIRLVRQRRRLPFARGKKTIENPSRAVTAFEVTLNNTDFTVRHIGTALLTCSEGAFRVRKIYGDGNCMFRAISYILWDNEEEHKSLRDMVVRHIRQNWQEYGPFVVAEWNISNPDEYVEYMNSDGIYASELECVVATRLHRMNLSIYRVVLGKHEIKRVFHNSVHDDYRTARLLFSGRSDSGHYDVLLMDY